MFEMENFQGDLTDIVRASTSGAGAYSYGCATGVSSDFSLDPTSCDHLWPQLPSDDPMNFGDPFSITQDPLLHHHEPHMPGSSSAFNFVSSNSPEMIVGSHGFCGDGSVAVSERPCNIFSRMLQISPSSKFGDGVTPCDSPAVGNSASSTSTKASAAAPMAPSSDNITNNGNSSKPLCLIDNSGLQISSPRNPAIKRRKSQVKKVVCIPAPAPANSRPSSGEVVPSDLWAWRKYGQKPIKGSPYPRGYYRCSSSKGCSARKQVERSRNDPNMLVITYTSEHNHPWPTQRNALAGSTRAQPSRSNMMTNASSASRTTAIQKTIPKDEQNCKNNSKDGELASPLIAAANNSAVSGAIKEELEDQMEKVEVEMDDGDQFEDQEFPYELTLPVSNHCGDDFFADFGEMNDQSDPLNNYLLFSQNLTENDEGSKDPSKAPSLDPFAHLYDWPENNITNSNTNSFKEAKGR